MKEAWFDTLTKRMGRRWTVQRAVGLSVVLGSAVGDVAATTAERKHHSAGRHGTFGVFIPLFPIGEESWDLIRPYTSTPPTAARKPFSCPAPVTSRAS